MVALTFRSVQLMSLLETVRLRIPHPLAVRSVVVSTAARFHVELTGSRCPSGPLKGVEYRMSFEESIVEMPSKEPTGIIKDLHGAIDSHNKRDVRTSEDLPDHLRVAC